MRITSLAVAAALAFGLASLSAQTPRAGTGNPVSTSLRQQWDSVKKNISESAEIMPEANYDFRPVESVRTFGQILAHVAGANYLFCAASKGEKKAPHAEDEFEKTAKTKTEIVKALNDSLTYCDGQFTALDDKSGAEMVDMPFGPKMARAGVLMMNIGHLNEHYGNLVTYFRIKGIVPPSSRPAK